MDQLQLFEQLIPITPLVKPNFQAWKRQANSKYFHEDKSQEYKTQFQTPTPVCKYMVSLIPEGVKSVLEPTPGEGNIVKELSSFDVTAPDDFFKIDKISRFDCVVMNHPFSSKYVFNLPKNFDHLGMRVGYYILTECMKMSDTVIALMPWFTISDSDFRLRTLHEYGLKSVTALPRKTFQYARIQTCVLHLERGHNSKTEFKIFTF